MPRSHLVVGGLACLASTAWAGPPAFVRLGDVAPGDVDSIGQAISASGLVVTGRCTPAGSQNVFRWTSSGMVGLGGPNLALGTGISADGSVIVGYNATFSGNVQAFRWTSANGFEAYTGLTTSSPGPRAMAVSADGSVAVGDSNTALHATAVRWTAPGAAIALSNEAAFTDSSALGISGDGSIIVGVGSNVVGVRAFRWTSAGMVALPDLDGGEIRATANAISQNGSVIVGFGTSTEGQQACAWKNNAPVGLGDLPGGTFESSALAASSDGSVIVGFGTTAVGQAAFVWDNIQGMRDLQSVLVSLSAPVSGWSLTQATGVSADGTVIVGYGTNPDGRTEAWLARLPLPISCYANCDNSTAPPQLNVLDFICFINKFAVGCS